MKPSHQPHQRLLFSVCMLGIILLISGCNLLTSTEDRFNQALEHREKGELNAAAIEFKNVLKKEPNHAQARWLLGKTYLEMKDGLSAKKELQRAFELGVKDDELILALAQAQLLTNEPAETLRLIESTPELMKGAEGLVLKGEAQLALGQVEEADRSFQAALEADPENLHARYGLIRIAFGTRDFEEAASQIDKVLSSSPGNYQGLVFKAELALSQGNPQLAIDAYQQAVKQNDTVIVRLGLARALLAVEQPEQAETHIDKVLAKVPDNLAGRYLKAVSATQRKDYASAKAQLQEVLGMSPNHYPSMLLLGAIHFNLGEYEQALNQLVNYLAEDAANVRAKKLLAQAYIKLGDTERAIDRLESAADSTPDDPELLGMLGNLYTSMGDYTTGEGYYEKALKLAPGAKDLETRMALNRWASGNHDQAIADLNAIVADGQDFMPAELALITAQMQAKDYTQALQASRKLIDKRPEMALGYVMAASALDAMQKRDEARDYLQRAIDADPVSMNSYLMLARFDHEAGKLTEAKGRLEAALAQKADDEKVLLMLAKLEEEAGNEARAMQLVEQARSGNPKALMPRVLLASKALQDGRPDDARQFVDEGLAIAPDNQGLLLLAADIALAKHEWDAASSIFDRVLALDPTLVDVQMKRGSLQTRLGNLTAARNAFNAVLAQDPGHPGARWALGEIELREGNQAQALKVAKGLVKAQPGHPAGYSLQGDVQMQQRQYDAAEASYRKAYSLAQEQPFLIKTTKALKAQGKDGEALTLMRQWLETHPDDVSIRVAYATDLQIAGEIDSALAEYGKITERQPDNVVVLNNMAWLYQQQGELEKARTLADKAYTMAPQIAGVIDTFGWILVNSGELDRGLKLLEEAVAKSQGEADIRYHLAAAHARAGNVERARSDLESLLSEQAAFSEREQARKLLESLR